MHLMCQMLYQMLYQVTDYTGCILEKDSYSEMGNTISCTKKAVR